MTRSARYRLFALTFAVCVSGGCASLTNPVSDGIPVRRLPDGVFAQPKSDLQPVPLNLLRINEPGDYKLDKGDVLAIVADEVLTKDNQPVPVQLLQNPNASKSAVQGLPVPVQDDGTILLPLLDPIDVRGKTVIEVRKLLIDQIVNKKKLVVEGKERVLVELMQPRRYRVLVVREDSQPLSSIAVAGNAAAVVGGKKGAAFALLLEPGRNDLLQALTQSGGPPGVDAKNEVIIRRGKYDPTDPAKGYVRVPLRARVDQPLTFTESDITLEDGDTVYIEARDTEVYCTAGLLGAAQLPLPRDSDLRVVEAVAQARGTLTNNSCVLRASWVTVVRRLPNGQEIPIRVELNDAVRDLRENIIIQPGDLIVFPERP